MQQPQRTRRGRKDNRTAARLTYDVRDLSRYFSGKTTVYVEVLCAAAFDLRVNWTSLTADVAAGVRERIRSSVAVIDQLSMLDQARSAIFFGL
jgi:hypothetical protein